MLVWSGIGPHDRPTWLLEVAPAVIGAAVLWFTWDRFTLTTLTYVLILLHCIVLIVGGHYTYAEVPLGEWLQQAFEQNLMRFKPVQPGLNQKACAAPFCRMYTSTTSC